MKKIVRATFAAVCAVWTITGCKNVNSPIDVLAYPFNLVDDLAGNSTECEVCGKRVVSHSSYDRHYLESKRCSMHISLIRKCPECSEWTDQKIGLCSTCIKSLQQSFRSSLESTVASNNLILAQILSQLDHNKVKELYGDDDSSQKIRALVASFLQNPTNRCSYVFYSHPDRHSLWTSDGNQPRFFVNEQAIYCDAAFNKLNNRDILKKAKKQAENNMDEVIGRAQAVLDFIRADDEKKVKRTRLFQSGDASFKFANAEMKDKSIPLYKDIVSGVTKEWCHEWIKSKNLESAKRDYGLAIDDGGNILNLYFDENALSQITIRFDEPMTVAALTNRVHELYGDKVQVSHRGGTAIEADLDLSIETMWLFVKRHKYSITDSETVAIDFDKNDLVGLTYYDNDKIQGYKLFWDRNEQMRLAKWQNGYEDAVVTADGKISYPRGSGFENLPESMRIMLSDKLVEAMRMKEKAVGLGRIRMITIKNLKMTAF